MQPVLTHPFPTRRPSELTIPVNSRVPPVTGAAVATRTNGGCVRGSVSPPLQADRASVVAPVRRRYAVRGLRVITDISQKGRCLSITGVTLMSIGHRSEEHTSELQSLMRKSNAVFC